MPLVTDRYRSLGVSWIDTMPLRKGELMARGVDVIDLGAGDADLDPPAAAVARLREAAGSPALGRYGFGMGHRPFREAAARFMEERFGERFDPITETIPLIGSKEGLSLLALAYLSKGDAVIVPEPGFVSYIGGARLSEGEPFFVPLRPEKDFLLDVDEIPPEVADRARLMYLNYPNNPTAATAPLEYLERVVAWCREHDVLLAYDNAYSELAFDGYVPPSIFQVPGARDVAIEFHTLSKTYNMTGWRLAWANGAPEFIEVLAKVKTFVDMGQMMAVQAAGVAALEARHDFIPQNLAVFRERRDAAVDAWRAAGFHVEVPKATMYVWIRLPEGVDDIAFTRKLMEEAGVIVTPGQGLGPSCAGYFRIALTTGRARIEEGAERAGRVLAGMLAAPVS
ncbi:LL-diaminopimelate aminotransferase [soil metagenome]